MVNSLRFCDQSQYDVPFLTTFKIVGNYPMPYGIRLAGVYQSIPGAERPTIYAVGRAQIPTLTQATVNVRLDAPGEQYYGRVNQLDLSIGREFVFGRARLTPKLNFYNILNVNPVLVEVNTFGSSLGRPTIGPAAACRAHQRAAEVLMQLDSAGPCDTAVPRECFSVSQVKRH